MGAAESKPEWDDKIYYTEDDIQIDKEFIEVNGVAGETGLEGQEKVHICRWSSKKKDWKPKALIVVSHGVHEHGLRYYLIAWALVRAGYVVVAPDQAWHGHNSIPNPKGKKGLVESKDVLVDTFVNCAKTIHKQSEFKDLRMFCLAHSMGCLVALLACKKQPALFEAVVFSGPPLVLGPAGASPWGCECLFPVTKVDCMFSAVVGCMSTLDPAGPAAPIKVEDVVGDESSREIMRKDELRVHSWVVNRTAGEISRMIKECHEYIPNFSHSFAVLHGKGDGICDPISAQILYDKSCPSIATTKKTIKLYDNFKHEIFHESLPSVSYVEHKNRVFPAIVDAVKEFDSLLALPIPVRSSAVVPLQMESATV